MAILMLLKGPIAMGPDLGIGLSVRLVPGALLPYFGAVIGIGEGAIVIGILGFDDVEPTGLSPVWDR